MPKTMIRPALVRLVPIAALLSATTACTPVAPPGYTTYQPQPPSGEALDRLASALAQEAPDTRLLPPSPACGTNSSIVRGVFPERVLFATASDQPAPDAAGTLDLLAGRIRGDAPGAEVTVLGHTDSVGSDAYNMDLSRRRALSVLRGLQARGIDPNRLSAVAIGKRQPIADNSTAAGRALNRRVEFLISDCLAANLDAVRAQGVSAAEPDAPVAVLRLDPSSAYGLAPVGAISLQTPATDRTVPASLAPADSAQPPALQPPATVARPAPAPHYHPLTLSPNAQPNPLGPAVPY